jgi:hypothetical protein
MLVRIMLALMLSAGIAHAQTEKAAPPPKAAQPVVSAQEALYLVRSTLLTLNDANKSGNYTVLHDLAAPGFQAANTAADLARIFTDLRERKFDLFGVLLIVPKFHAPPRMENGRLRLRGVFPTRPLAIDFDLLFEKTGGAWHLFGIAVTTPPAEPEPKAPAQKGSP